MNEPKNHPTRGGRRTRSGSARRPFTSLALLALLAVAAAVLVGCGGQQGSKGPSAAPEPPASGETTNQPDAAPATGSEGSTQDEEGRSASETPAVEAGSEASGPPTLGDADAPVTMVEYADFQ